jgi:transcription antitermination factor NusG
MLSIETGPDAWYALYTKHQHEKKAGSFLEKRGFEVLLPTYQSANRWKDRTKIVSVPIFPCYLFVKTGLERKLDLLRAPGVFWMVGNSRGASVVPAQEIEALQKIMRSKVRAEPHPYLKSGDRVRVRSGPLSGLEGILVRVKNIYRVVLSVELLQKAVAAEVDLSVVERINLSREIVQTQDDSKRRA